MAPCTTALLPDSGPLSHQSSVLHFERGVRRSGSNWAAKPTSCCRFRHPHRCSFAPSDLADQVSRRGHDVAQPLPLAHCIIRLQAMLPSSVDLSRACPRPCAVHAAQAPVLHCRGAASASRALAPGSAADRGFDGMQADRVATSSRHLHNAMIRPANDLCVASITASSHAG